MRARGRLVASLLLLVSFGVGALSGMAAEEAFGIDWFEFLEDSGDRQGDRLLTGLDLTSEQRARAEEVLDRQEDHLEDYWEARLPEIRRILDESYAEIRGMLPPAQHGAFDDRVRALDGRIPAEVDD